MFVCIFFPFFSLFSGLVTGQKNQGFSLEALFGTLGALYWKNNGKSLLWQFVAKTSSLEHIGRCLSHLQDNCVEFYSRIVILSAIFQAG